MPQTTSPPAPRLHTQVYKHTFSLQRFRSTPRVRQGRLGYALVAHRANEVGREVERAGRPPSRFNSRSSNERIRVHHTHVDCIDEALPLPLAARPPVDPDEFEFDSTHDEYDDEYALDLGGYL